MATTPDVLPAPTLSEEERFYIASQWKLVWMRFRRHRLALFSVAVLTVFYLVVLFPEFLAIHDPLKVDSQRVFVGPQRIHFFDGFRPTFPYVKGLKVTRNSGDACGWSTRWTTPSALPDLGSSCGGYEYDQL